jgi:cytochrome oxidase Cu insertion factor (SCO1/SenC/PrrC family)
MAAFFSMKDEHINDITERLLNINWRYRNEPDVWIVCFSTDGANDIPSITVPYVENNTKYNRYSNKWQFLRGDQPTMDSFIRNGFLIDDLSKEARFRLVDGNGQIRALYGNTEFHFKSASEDIALLKKEIDLRKYNERKQKEQ